MGIILMPFSNFTTNVSSLCLFIFRKVIFLWKLEAQKDRLIFLKC